METGGWDESRSSASAEEEASKRNTDCVYFLASPLTCKKGAECEYRHSEGARINPRDCWYWLNSTCLNPKCLFRHPPLDSLIGIPAPPSGPAYPTEASASQTSTHASNTHNSNKQSIPCYYFQKGICLKGDKCAFLHGTTPIVNSVVQQVQKVSAPVAENSQMFRCPSWSLNKCTSQPNAPQKRVNAASVIATSIKPVEKAEKLPDNISVAKNSKSAQPDVKLPHTSHRSSNACSDNAPSRPQTHQCQHLPGHIKNEKGADESLQSSPCDENEHRDASGIVAHCESDTDAGQEHQRPFDEIFPERRTRKEESPVEIDNSDLRHRLQKHRRLNGNQSVISSKQHGHLKRDDRIVGEDYQSVNSCRDQFPHEGSISKRLQGRIVLPVGTSTSNTLNLRSSRAMERGRSSQRPLPGMSMKGRLQDRLRQWVHGDFSAETRNAVGIFIREETGSQENISTKSNILSGEQNMRLGKSLGLHEIDSCSFEGPKPLSVILKRKRGVNSGSCANTSNEGESDIKFDAPEISAVRTVIADTSTAQMIIQSSGSDRKDTFSNIKEPEVNSTLEEEEGLITTDGEEQQGVQSSAKEDLLEIEDDMMVENQEDAEYENYELGDEEFEFEEINGEEFQTEDDERFYQDNDEEGDDFDRKLGVMFS